MNEVKKAVKKGFTLVELIVVMAIFAILMAAVMTITDPISRMFKNTSVAEKTYSTSHNIQVYLQGALEYSDSLYVFTGDQIDQLNVTLNGTDYDIGNGNDQVDDEELAGIAEMFRDQHYDQIITYDGAQPNPDHFTKGTIYVLKLMNNATATFPQGQITRRGYDFVSSNKILSTAAPTEVAQLNSAYFNAKDATYSFSYALGSSDMVVVDDPFGKGDTYKALKKDLDNELNGVKVDDLSISIVIDKKADKNGFSDVAISGSSDTYRAFKSPVAVQVANLPLTNINLRRKYNGLNSSQGVARYVKQGGEYKIQGSTGVKSSGQGWWTAINDKIDFNNDIYFVYAYADELK